MTRRLSPPAQPVVLITGAGDGIGRALARIYRARGARVVGVGRRMRGLVPPGLCDDYCRVDLAQPYAAAIIADALRQRGIERLDLLIHCAGIGSYGAVDDQSSAEIEALLDVNLRAPITLTHALLPLLAAARGRVVMIGSVVAALPAPNYAVYGATKAALEGFARSLRAELRGAVEVQVVHPGATRTGMHATSGAPLDRIGWRRFPSPEKTAAGIVDVIDHGASVATVGVTNRLLRFAGRYVGRVADIVAARSIVPSSRDALNHHSPVPGAMRHCVVTGGAHGIGQAVVEQYARAGWSITIIDRDAAQAARLCRALCDSGVVATFIEADLAQPLSIDQVVHRLAALPPASVVVHSAGISAVGAFAAIPLDVQQAVLDVNLRAPLLLTAGLLRNGLLAPRAALVFIASLSVYTGYPGAAVYAATKEGLAAYARSLRVALASRAIHVATVYPGPTRTAHARRYSPDNRREQRRMPPERVAQSILAAVEQRRAEVIPGMSNRLIAVAGRVAPALTICAMRKAIIEQLPHPETWFGPDREAQR